MSNEANIVGERIEYAGWTIKQSGDGWVAGRTREGMPHGMITSDLPCTCKTAEDAVACVQIYLAVGENDAKFWHLNYAIQHFAKAKPAAHDRLIAAASAALAYNDRAAWPDGTGQFSWAKGLREALILNGVPAAFPFGGKP